MVKRITALFCTLLVLTGCGIYHGKKFEDRNDAIRADERATQSRLKQQHAERDSLAVDDTIFVADASDNRIERSRQLPESINQPIPFNVPADMSLFDVADKLSSTVGVSIRVNPTLMASSGDNDPLAMSRPIRFKGTVEELLDKLATRTNTYWEYNKQEDVVSFFRYKTAKFNLEAFPGSISREFSINRTSSSQSGGSGEGSGGGEAQSGLSAGYANQDMNMLKSIVRGVQAMVSEEGTVQLVESNRDLIVRDHPSTIQDIKQYVKAKNEEVNRQVSIQFQLFRVNVDDEQNKGINWNVLARAIRNNLNIRVNLQTFSALNNNGALLSVPGSTSNSFGGSSAFVQALRETTDATRSISETFMAKNFQTVPFQKIRSIGYLKEVSVTQVEGGSTQQSLTQGQAKEGFTLVGTPFIKRNGEVDLELAMTNSDVENIQNISPPGSSNLIQVPTISKTESLHRVTMNSGDMLVLSGYRQISSTLEKNRSMFASLANLFESDNEKVIMTITPVVKDSI